MFPALARQALLNRMPGKLLPEILDGNAAETKARRKNPGRNRDETDGFGLAQDLWGKASKGDIGLCRRPYT